MNPRQSNGRNFSFLHVKRISFIGVFGLNAISQTLVGGWIASQDLKAFSVFALVTGLGNLLAFLDFGAGTIAQTNYLGYLRSGSSKSIVFVKLAAWQSLLISGSTCLTGTTLLILSRSSIVTLLSVYLIFLGLTISSNLAINLIYAYGRSELALLLSRTSWFWTLLTIAVFKDYFAENLDHVSLIAVAAQFLSGIVAIIFCIVKLFFKDSPRIGELDDATRFSYLREYKSLALATGLAGIPLMVSLHADRYIISYVNGTTSISSLAAYGTLFSGTIGILNYLYYKKRAETNYSNLTDINYQIKSFVRIILLVGFFYFATGQLVIYFLYPAEISNLIIHFFYFLALLSVGFSLGLQMKSVSIDYQRVIVQSSYWQSLANIALTFALSHFFGGIAGPLSTILAVLFVQIPILYTRSSTP